MNETIFLLLKNKSHLFLSLKLARPIPFILIVINELNYFFDYAFKSGKIKVEEI